MRERGSELQAPVVLTHPDEGGHPGHDSTACAVSAAVGRIVARGESAPAVLEFTSYHNGNSAEGPSWMKTGEFLPNSRCGAVDTYVLPVDERARKARMFDCFESQRHVLAHFPQ